jgi:AcrR family transcriptional regulator
MQKRSEETRARILSAASDLFARNGYDATGVAEICQAAGVSKGAFYHHFPTKQQVFVALLEDWLAGVDARMGGFLAQGADIPQGLVAMTAITHEIFERASGQLPMFLEFWRESSHNPAVWKATIAPYRQYTDLFAGVIQRGVEEGSLRPVNPHSAARTVVALALGLILQGVMDPQGAAWTEVARDGMSLLVNGLSKTIPSDKEAVL